MRETLLRSIGDADALRHLKQLSVPETPVFLGYQVSRQDDLYISLVGEIFDRLREGNSNSNEWARLANALGQYAAADRKTELVPIGVAQNEAALLSAVAFYFGGFPASAYLTMKSVIRGLNTEGGEACFDLLGRPRNIESEIVKELLRALVEGDPQGITRVGQEVQNRVSVALEVGPSEWVSFRLLLSLIHKFEQTNLRAVLPDGSAEFWTPLINSFVKRGVWEFFPSQIQAIKQGLLVSDETFSLQMPTGAGKTALCETLLFSHSMTNPAAAAVLLVPYRSLASELRRTLVWQLNQMGITARCAYGGTVPSANEVQSVDDAQVLVATPESLSGLLTANVVFSSRISLVICDEGHLLDSPGRGIGLELLLARLKARESSEKMKFVFLSAIIPNIEEINLWLGGTDETVTRSDFRPAIAEFAVLRPIGEGGTSTVDLEMHPHEDEPIRYRIERFLRPNDFHWLNQSTGKCNKYVFSSVKTQAIATARKVLPMGTVAVFAANKRGRQGAIGLAEELLHQLDVGIDLPKPVSFSNQARIEPVLEYLTMEYGANWVGTRAIGAGAILHHGDIPQETREVYEILLRSGDVPFCICTNTLAEGVNFPIRTLVLYSVQRLLGQERGRENLLTRDIKNLVGRAGRAGSTTRGLVVCANQNQWFQVEKVAKQVEGEPVIGALRKLVSKIEKVLTLNRAMLTNKILEESPSLFALVDGIDSTLVELAATEIGEDRLVELARAVAVQTFAAKMTEGAIRERLTEVFELRAKRIVGMRDGERLNWVQEAGAKIRMVDLVENGLMPMRSLWNDVTSPVDAGLVDTMLKWAWTLPDLKQSVRNAYRLQKDDDCESVRIEFRNTILQWLSGEPFVQIATVAGRSVDETLSIYSGIIEYDLQTLCEQGIALLEKILIAQNGEMAPSVRQFPEALRFGVPTPAGCRLAAKGVRHRKAFVALGMDPEVRGFEECADELFLSATKQIFSRDKEKWVSRLGILVFTNTDEDLNRNP